MVEFNFKRSLAREVIYPLQQPYQAIPHMHDTNNKGDTNLCEKNTIGKRDSKNIKFIDHKLGMVYSKAFEVYSLWAYLWMTDIIVCLSGHTDEIVGNSRGWKWNGSKCYWIKEADKTFLHSSACYYIITLRCKNGDRLSNRMKDYDVSGLFNSESAKMLPTSDLI